MQTIVELGPVKGLGTLWAPSVNYFAPNLDLERAPGD